MNAMQLGFEASLLRLWFRTMVRVSLLLVLVTFASYALAKHGLLSSLLFWVGLGGENNLGAWWSGMLLLTGAVHAFDGFADTDNRPSARHGWLALSLMLLALSFDEVAALHEFLAGTGNPGYWLVLGIIGVILLAYSMSQLALSHCPWRLLALILLSFVLFGSVVLQELYQTSRTWSNPVVYGIRAVLEEGTEIAGMLILIFVTRMNTHALLNKNRPDGLMAVAHGRIPLIIAISALIPITVGATFILPFPGGPADWLAACTYLVCALRVIHPVLIGNEELNKGTVLLLLFYLVSSAASNGLKLSWDPEILGVPVSIRGIGVAALLLMANTVFKAAGRRTSAWFYAVASVILIASLLTRSQLLWCTIPSCAALWMFVRESRRNSL